MIYIQRRYARHLETVDETPSRQEAKRLLTEYRMSDPAGTYYLSQRACKAWRTS